MKCIKLLFIKAWIAMLLLFSVMLVLLQSCEIKEEKEISSTYGSVELDGYNYKTIILGNGQEWMAENLKTKIYSNGDTIQNSTTFLQWQRMDTSGIWCYLKHNSSNDSLYGKIYNWNAVIDKRNVCPNGWKVPSLEDFEKLVEYLFIVDEDGSKNSKVGNKLKAKIPTANISSFYYEALDIIGFSAHPSGELEGQVTTFKFEESISRYWTTTLSNPEVVETVGLYRGSNILYSQRSISYRYGLSIRCIKN